MNSHIVSWRGACVVVWRQRVTSRKEMKTEDLMKPKMARHAGPISSSLFKYRLLCCGRKGVT